MKRLTLTALASALALLLVAPAAQADFGLASQSVELTDSLDDPFTQAGAHPYAFVTDFSVETVPDPSLGSAPDGNVKDLQVTLPPGLIANPTALPKCTTIEFVKKSCPASTQVGTTVVTYPEPGFTEQVSVFGLTPPFGAAAKFGFYVGNAVPVTFEGGVSPEAPFNLTAALRNTSQALPFYGATTTLWGNPAAQTSSGIPEVAFLTTPRSCPGTSLSFGFAISSWQDPGALLPDGRPDLAGPNWLSYSATAPATEECETLGFDPEVTAAPTTNVASSPSGFDFSIEVEDPGLTDPAGRAETDLKRAVVTLPEGLAVNPASANGLGACSEADLARETFDSGFGEGCPAASRVATVAVTTPLLEETLEGSIFIATPYENPFGTLLAGYLVLKSPERGVVLRLPGKIEASPSGRITAGFDQNPQFPFELLEVSFKSGSHAPLTTPPTCGSYEVRTELYPWSGGAADISTQPFAIAQSPNGASCPASAAALPHAPGFDAGTLSPIARAHSPFVLNLSRLDGSQRFKAVTISPPPGLVAKLAGTETCSEAALAAAASRPGKEEQASPSCPTASRIGSVYAAAGSGPDPYWAPGTAYLTGPYKGAPLSMAIVTPATAGPFDLGTIVVRTALHVDSKTAEITAVSDPLPEILQGIPLDIRAASVRLDRPGFTLNGTSCDPSAVTGQLTSNLGAIASLSSRFQLGECGRLGFKPKMTLKLRGGTKRGRHPQLTIALMPRPGDANIASVSVALPRSEFLDQGNIRTVCTRVQFAADSCPAAAIYGEATVDTPLLDYDLAGHVYLRSSDNLLPDVVPDLRGPAHQPIKLETSGRTDSIRGGIRTTIDFVPDAPFTKAVVALQGGNKSLLVNSRDICARTFRATVRYTAHNGMSYVDHPKMRARCGGKQGKRGKKGKRGGHKRSAVR
jgi:hypothetical protein